MPRPGSAQPEAADRLVDGACSALVTPVEDQLICSPRRQVWRGGKCRKLIAVPRPSARHRQVWLERARLRDQAGANALRLHLGSQLTGRLRAHAELEPDDADKAPAFERSDIAELQREADELLLGQPVGDAFRHRGLDIADEADGEMQVRDGRPAKFGRPRSTGREVRLQLLAVRLGYRQPEERPDAQCVFCTQLAGAQRLGAVGRQP